MKMVTQSKVNQNGGEASREGWGVKLWTAGEDWGTGGIHKKDQGTSGILRRDQGGGLVGSMGGFGRITGAHGVHGGLGGSLPYSPGHRAIFSPLTPSQTTPPTHLTPPTTPIYLVVSAGKSGTGRDL